MYNKHLLYYKDYLKELQWRFSYVLGGILLAIWVSYGQRDIIFYLLVESLEGVINNSSSWQGWLVGETSSNSTMIYLKITEAFNLSIYLCVVVSLLVSLPLFWLQVWFFLVPALYLKEETFLRRLILGSFFFLVPSLMFTKNLLLPQIWSFFLSFDQSFPNISYMPSMMPYVQLSLNIYGAIIISSQGPLLIYWLTHWQWIPEEFWVEKRAWIIMALLVWAAFITPPDLYSLCIIVFPLCIFYELFLWFNFCKKAFHNIAASLEIRNSASYPNNHPFFFCLPYSFSLPYDKEEKKKIRCFGLKGIKSEEIRKGGKEINRERKEGRVKK